jgi:outer membrane receptor for ferric coprogen and ferric-rhodotorulic acid
MNMHVRVPRRPKLKQVALLVGLALPLFAHAGDVAPDGVPDADKIQKVQVSAQKAELNAYTVGSQSSATPLDLSLRETPQSVSVVTLQRIEDQRLNTVTDVVNTTTGVSVNQYETNRGQFTARGFEIDNLQIDGLPTTYEQAWSGGEVASSLAIYDRVEIVRGATGLMTGAGNPSAAINLVRKHADSKQLNGWLEAGVGRWNERRVMGDVSTPLNSDGTIRARVVGEHTQGDSWVERLNNKSNTFYATVSADLTPDTVLSAGYSHQDNHLNGSMWGSLPYWYSDGTVANWDRSKSTAAGWTRWPTSYGSAFLDLQHAFDNGWKLRATYNHGDRKADSHLLYLSSTPDRLSGEGLFDFSGSYLTRTKQDDVGLHLSGPFQLAGRRHEAAFGAMHMKQTFNSDSRAADYGNVSSAVGDFNHWNGAAYPEPSWGAPTFYETSQTRQDSVYGVARFSLADPLKAIVGARVTNYEKTGYGLYTAAYTLKHDHEVTPYAGLVYDISRNYSVYASYTDIFQPQNAKDLAGNILDPVVGKSYEAGVKGEFFGGRLNGSLAVFKIKQDGLAQAVDRVDRGNGPEIYYRAADGTKSEGFEFDLSGELARGWNATAGYTQYRAKDGLGAEVNSIYPRRLLRVFTTWRLPDAWSGLTVGGGVNWEGSTWTIDPSAPATTNGVLEQEKHALVNLMARYDFSSRLSAQLNVSNVLDKPDFGMSAAYGGITYGAPRSASLTLRYRF